MDGDADSVEKRIELEFGRVQLDERAKTKLLLSVVLSQELSGFLHLVLPTPHTHIMADNLTSSLGQSLSLPVLLPLEFLSPVYLATLTALADHSSLPCLSPPSLPPSTPILAPSRTTRTTFA